MTLFWVRSKDRMEYYLIIKWETIILEPNISHCMSAHWLKSWTLLNISDRPGGIFLSPFNPRSIGKVSLPFLARNGSQLQPNFPIPLWFRRFPVVIFFRPVDQPLILPTIVFPEYCNRFSICGILSYSSSAKQNELHLALQFTCSAAGLSSSSLPLSAASMPSPASAFV